MFLLLSLLSCAPDVQELTVGDFTIELDRKAGSLHLRHLSGSTLEDLRLLAGTGTADVEMQFGSFRFDNVTAKTTSASAFSKVRARMGPPWILEVFDADEEHLGMLTIGTKGDALVLDWAPSMKAEPGEGRVGLSAACEQDDHFLGLGSHAFDVDHVGEAFAIWTSEPGIGKSDVDDYPPDWQLTGTRHSTSFPSPFLLRPQSPQGLLLDTSARVEVDLCATDPRRFELLAWQGNALRMVWFADGSALRVVQDLTAYTGRPELPPPWVFSPWNDAIRGREEVERVATVLREAGASTSVIWSEDWKGGEENGFGYHLTGEWTLDESLYPDATDLADQLEAQGFKWFAYFSPFVFEGTEAYEDALAHDVVLQNEQGEPYLFPGATFKPTSLVDLSTSAGRSWFQGYMEDALAIGFDGWMADYAEWLPADAWLRNGRRGIEVHNAYPEWWQETHREVIDGRDASFFVRSGWIRTGGLVPVVWAGDQRTSFDRDDGLPSVLALGLGLSASGVPVFTHDVAGYQSVGNPPADRELWFRWASLGAYTPIFRTHHGAFDEHNWKFDTDDDTLAHYVRVTDEHMRLFPYRYGLAARASREGIPMILPIAFLYGSEWDRIDAWMLGDALLVAPILEEGASGRQVDLPDQVGWYDWRTLQPASSGYVDAPLDEIPVFAAAGTTVPTFAQVPETLVEGADPGLVRLEDVDGERIVYLFGGGGRFEEADGTFYRPTGRPSGPGQVTETLTRGEVEVAGVTVEVAGPVERTYTFVVVP